MLGLLIRPGSSWFRHSSARVWWSPASPASAGWLESDAHALEQGGLRPGAGEGRL